LEESSKNVKPLKNVIILLTKILSRISKPLMLHLHKILREENRTQAML